MTEQRARELPKRAGNEIESEPQIDDSFTGLQKRQLAMFQRALSERDHYPEALRTVYVNLLRVPGDHAAAIAGFAKAILDGKTLQEAYKVVPPPTPSTDSVREALAIEQVAQFLHDEGGFDEASSSHTWPEHAADTGQRDGGFVKIAPSDVQAKFRDVARRLLTMPLARAALQSSEADNG